MGHNNTIPNGHPDKERVSNTPKKHPGGGYAEKCFGGTVAERKRCGAKIIPHMLRNGVVEKGAQEVVSTASYWAGI